MIIDSSARNWNFFSSGLRLRLGFGSKFFSNYGSRFWWKFGSKNHFSLVLSRWNCTKIVILIEFRFPFSTKLRVFFVSVPVPEFDVRNLFKSLPTRALYKTSFSFHLKTLTSKYWKSVPWEFYTQISFWIPCFTAHPHAPLIQVIF